MITAVSKMPEFIQKDSKGRIITLIQVVLVMTGFGEGIVFDENYGPTTAKCVSNFQLANGLVADGNFGPQTRQMVKARYGLDLEAVYKSITKSISISTFVQPNGDKLFF